MQYLEVKNDLKTTLFARLNSLVQRGKTSCFLFTSNECNKSWCFSKPFFVVEPISNNFFSALFLRFQTNQSCNFYKVVKAVYDCRFCNVVMYGNVLFKKAKHKQYPHHLVLNNYVN